MDLAAGTSAPTAETTPAIEKAREKQRRKINESISGLKPEHQIEFLIARLAESRVGGEEQKKEMDQLKREAGKMNTKIDAAQKLLGKTELAKSKLEQLCRELNKQQREEHEQNQLRLKQMQLEQAKTVESFKKSLAEIQQNMEAKHEHTKRVADVERLSNNLNQMAADYEARLTELKKLYEEREEDLGKMAQAKDKEQSAMRVQIDEMHKRVQEVFSENVELKKELLANEQRLKQSIESEMAMRKLLDDYSRKYGELTQSLANSNTSFDKVKDQMGKMNSNLIKSQAELKKWKDKAEEANKVAASISMELQKTQKSLGLKDRQLAQLQELCRRLSKKDQDQDTTHPAAEETTIGEEAIENGDGDHPANGGDIEADEQAGSSGGNLGGDRGEQEEEEQQQLEQMKLLDSVD